MKRVRQRGTAPEIAVRRAAYAMRLGYRLNRRDLPGSPDLVFPRLKAAVFVHGCFWHGHESCKLATVPGTNRDYWIGKLAQNKARDSAVNARLKSLGWRVLTIWQCQTRDTTQLTAQLHGFLICSFGAI
jgi:DNA mismatch endonuclease (patch repair protein)